MRDMYYKYILQNVVTPQDEQINDDQVMDVQMQELDISKVGFLNLSYICYN